MSSINLLNNWLKDFHQLEGIQIVSNIFFDGVRPYKFSVHLVSFTPLAKEVLYLYTASAKSEMRLHSPRLYSGFAMHFINHLI